MPSENPFRSNKLPMARPKSLAQTGAEVPLSPTRKPDRKPLRFNERGIVAEAPERDIAGEDDTQKFRPEQS